ncbi:hypothetical protein ACRTDR_19715 [Shewanella algae]
MLKLNNETADVAAKGDNSIKMSQEDGFNAQGLAGTSLQLCYKKHQADSSGLTFVSICFCYIYILTFQIDHFKFNADATRVCSP